MGRPLNPDLTKAWKIHLPATLAGTVELYLFDNIHGKPLYGSRSRLITELLSAWVEERAAQRRADYATNEERVDARN